MTDESSDGAGDPPSGGAPDGTIPVIVEDPVTEGNVAPGAQDLAEPPEVPVEVEVAGEPEAGAEAEVAAEAEGTDPAVSRLEELELALQVAEKEKTDNWDKYVRAVADHDNRMKRSKRELEDARVDSKIKVLREMLPVVDNLERAIEHAEGPSPEPNAILEGVRLVLRQFHHAFERLEVAQVEAEGQPFDPNIHEAISQVETDDVAPGMVVSVLQKGYRIGDRLLRPTMVVVAKAKAAP